MNYQKISKKHYNLHIIQTDRFKTITVKVNLKRKLVKEEITKRNMLINALFESTEHYPTKRLLEIQTEELYELSYRGVNYASGKFAVLNFDMTFINPKYTEENMDDESFAFLEELIFHPHIAKQEFAKDNYDMAYNIMHDYLVTLKEDVRSYSQIRMLEEMDDSIISYRSSGYMEDLEKLTSKDLYNYYLDVIQNDAVDIFVIGDVDIDRVSKLVEKHLPFKTNLKNKESHFYTHDYVGDEIKFVSEKVPKEQSTLVLGFKLDDISDYEKRYVLNVYNYILGGSTESNLFRVVREEHSLCYYITSSGQPLLNIGIIKAGINADDYEETLSLIHQELNKMQLGEFDEAKIENAKTTYINSLTELEDNPDNILSLYIGMEYLKADDIETRKKKIKEVTKEQIVAIANKIHLNMIFLLEGSDTNEEE